MVEAEQTIEATGSDVEAAIAAGLTQLDVDRDAVDVQVLDEGSRGLMGFGARDARVRLVLKPEPAPIAPVEPDVSEDTSASEPEQIVSPPVAEPAAQDTEEAQITRGALVELLHMMGFEQVNVDVRRADPAPGEKNPPLVLDVHGSGTDALIGRRGETMAALQHIARLIVGQETARRADLVIDVDGFKARREKTLRRLAKRLAEQAVRTQRTVKLEPMPPHERRIIHLTLRDDPQVTTQSVGSGDRRKVTIIPER
jgi:spoIIIJ-associated protein